MNHPNHDHHQANHTQTESVEDQHLMHNQHDHHDHNHMHGGPDTAQNFLIRFFIVTGLLIPLFIFSMPGMNLLGYGDFSYRIYIEFVIASVIFGFGLVFFQHAVHEIKSGSYGMMTLVSIAVGSGYLYSAIATFFPVLEMEFYLEISTLIWVLLFGHYLEAKSSTAAGDALQEVAKLLPKEAHVTHGDQVHDMPISELTEGDRVLVKPGEKVPADGVIAKGESSFNESHLTGESKPITKTIGERVVAGAISIDSSVEIILDRVGESSTIGQIKKLIANAQQTKPSAQRLADRAASWLTFSALIVALLTILVWSVIIGEPFVFSFTLAITVLVIACPHALGLAIPTVSTIATRLAVKNGIFIKDMGKLETVKDVNYVVFDKTGTLTEGNFGVTQVLSLQKETTEKDILAIAASLEKSSSHVIGISIVLYAQQQQIPLKEVSNFKNIPGMGISGQIGKAQYFIGNEAMMKERNLLADEVRQSYQQYASQGQTIVFIANERQILGLIALADQIKPSAKAAIDALHALHIKVAMLTGDNRAVGQSVSQQLQIDTFFAEVLPETKYAHIKSLQDQGSKVIMVGDGVNDAPALTQADVGVAIGAGTDVAVESGDIILTHSNPKDIVSLIVLAQKVYAKMYQNLWWALGYNIVAIPAAAGVFVPFGFQLSPQMGALAMAFSSVIVVINAMTLRSAKLK